MKINKLRTHNLKLKTSTMLLFFIILLSVLLRLWKLGSIPPSLTPDEAALGYNAYSILNTGRDEYGKVLPIIFKSFGDYKPGFYIYLAAPFIALLGLNEYSVRLPSATAGIITVYLIYLITKELFGNRRLAILSAFISSITPWLIYFSRGAWEANVALTLTLAGIFFFLKSFRKPKFLIYSVLFFALTFITYQGTKLSTLIVVTLLMIIYWKSFWGVFKPASKPVIISTLIVSLCLVPVIKSYVNGEAGRLTVFSVFSYPRPGDQLQKFLSEDNDKVGSLRYYLFHTESLNYFRGIMGRWFNHMSSRFLFFEGDWSNPRHSSPHQGMLLMTDAIFLLAGLIVLCKRKLMKEILFVSLWLIFAPLPSVLSRNEVHAIRSMNMVIPLIIILSFGLNGIILWLQNIKTHAFIRATSYILLTALYVGSLIYFFDSYFVHLPNHDSKLWEYGYKQIVEVVSPIKDEYNEVIVQQTFAQPYIYFLFYGKYDPILYQSKAKLKESVYRGDVGQVERLDNIRFEDYSFPHIGATKSYIVVGNADRIHADFTKFDFSEIREIRYLNGKVAFRILEKR